MKKRLEALPLFLLVTSLMTWAQSGAVIPQGGAGHADQASCVILKRMGPADQVTSHLYSFGIRGKQFQYVEGKFPAGFPFHGRLTDHDLRDLQGRGAEALVLEPGYTADALKDARAECKKMTDKTPNQTPSELGASRGAAVRQPEQAMAPIAPPPQAKMISIGQTRDEVVATFGQPQKVIKMPTKELLYYPDMKVTLVEAKVADV